MRSVEFVREHFPECASCRESESNLGFAKGNNAGIKIARGDYVLILNPDTIIRDRALEKLVAFADCHPEAGAFGCRVLNPDGSFQNPARPIPNREGVVTWLPYVSAGLDDFRRGSPLTFILVGTGCS